LDTERLQEDIMPADLITGVDHRDLQGEPRPLESVSLELRRRLDDASRALAEVKAQQAALERRLNDARKVIEDLTDQQGTCSSLLNRFQTDHDAVVALGHEVSELIDHKAQERSGVIGTLEAVVQKTKETVVDSVEHVRDRAAAALHRLKGNDSGQKKIEEGH
jgi:chromosome segregation ATPase